MSQNDKDSNQDEINELKAEIKRLRAKEETSNFQEKKIFCSNCKVEVKPGSKYCGKCGTVIERNNSSNDITSKDRLVSSSPSNVNDSYRPQSSQYSDQSWDEIKSKRTTAGILAILFGYLGVHKFILGYSTEGFILLAVSIFGGIITCGLALTFTAIIAIIEGIIILTKTPEEFKRLYIDKKTGWF